MEEWAKSIIDTHRKPLKSLSTIGPKYFLPKNTEEEANLISKYLHTLSQVLSTERVERRCARAVGHWLPNKQMILVIKVSGIVNSFGFANKTGKYLYPEEGMFLLETNRIEIFWKSVPFSIQQAYHTLINDIDKYIQYRNFCLHGYRLKVNIKELIVESIADKGFIEHLDNGENEILRRLQSEGPKPFVSVTKQLDTQYKIHLPEQIMQSSEDLNFILSSNKEILTDIALSDGKTIIGLDGACYQFSSVNLSNLM